MVGDCEVGASEFSVPVLGVVVGTRWVGDGKEGAGDTEVDFDRYEGELLGFSEGVDKAPLGFAVTALVGVDEPIVLPPKSTGVAQFGDTGCEHCL